MCWYRSMRVHVRASMCMRARARTPARARTSMLASAMVFRYFLHPCSLSDIPVSRPSRDDVKVGTVQKTSVHKKRTTLRQRPSERPSLRTDERPSNRLRRGPRDFHVPIIRKNGEERCDGNDGQSTIIVQS